jgi:hypothetical protein
MGAAPTAAAHPADPGAAVERAAAGGAGQAPAAEEGEGSRGVDGVDAAEPAEDAYPRPVTPLPRTLRLAGTENR